MVNKKYIYLGVILILIIWVWLYLFNSQKDNIVWRIIDENSYDMSLLINDTWTWEVYNPEKYEKQEVDFWKIKSMVSVLCRLWNNVDTLLWTSSFKLIKQSVDNIWNEQENKERFLYVDLPWIVFDACEKNDSSFTDKLVTYLQAESLSVIENDKIDIKKYNAFIDKIEFDTELVDNSKLKENKEYFDKVFFENNLEAITSSYFSEYLYNAGSPDDFFETYSILSITDSNDVLEETLWNFESFLKKVWINWIEEFRIYLLKNSDFKNVDSVKDTLKNDYIKLQKLVKAEYDIELNSELSTSMSTGNFYKLNYSKVIENNEIKNLFNLIWKNYLLFSIISNDYADWLDETWSAKEFFWDHLVWNWIIKIWFIYLLNSKEK